MIESLFETLVTGGGYWNPIVFIIAFGIVDVITLIIYRAGEGDYTSELGGKPFLSGNPEISKENSHIAGGNLYWGLVEGLDEFYTVMKKMHTGIINDYIIWYLVVLVIVLFIFMGV